jgi:hypothetical protein
MGFELPMKKIDLNKTQAKNPMADGTGTILPVLKLFTNLK